MALKLLAEPSKTYVGGLTEWEKLLAHYHDMSQIPDEVCSAVYIFAKKAMNVLKEVLGVERVYLCTMCDGPVNHFHVQLIPRHPNTEIGSVNFKKPRMEYVHDEAVVKLVRSKLT